MIFGFVLLGLIGFVLLWEFLSWLKFPLLASSGHLPVGYGIQWIKDGSVEGSIMFMGGADSIDRAYRIKGYSWWPDEELSFLELNSITDIYLDTKPRVMVTHDAPQEVAELLFAKVKLPSFMTKLEPTRTRLALQRMWSAFSPELWIFGHWHLSFDQVLRGTRFICLAELEYKDIDV